jgi:hypothetical protein
MRQENDTRNAKKIILTLTTLIILLSATTKVLAATTYYNTSTGNNISIGNPLFVENSNSRIGIGTTNPSSQLHISGNTDTEITIQGTGPRADANTPSARMMFIKNTTSGTVTSGDAGHIIQFRGDDASGNIGNYGQIASIISNATAGSVTTDISFWTVSNTNIGTTSEAMRLQGKNLGIGTTTPTNKLQVNGTTNTTNLIVASLTSASCDVKSYTNGTLYCGSDATGSAADGTGGWTNTTTTTSTSLNVDVDSGTLYINSTNNRIGIGTTNPSRQLHIHNETSSSILLTNNQAGTTSTDGLFIGTNTNTNDTTIWNYENGYLRFATNNTENIRILASGNVGIGTITPANRLDVEGAAVIGSTYSGTNTAPTNGLLIEGQVGIGLTTPTSTLHVNGTTNTTQLVINGLGACSQALETYANGTIYCGTDNTGTSGGNASIQGTAGYIAQIQNGTLLNNSAIYQSSDGIGIVTTSPQSTARGIDISSGGRTLVIGADNDLTTRTDLTTKNARIMAAQYNNSQSTNTILIASSTETNNTLSIGGGTLHGNAMTDIKFYTSPNTTGTSGIQRMTINSAGNLGIGTTTPGNTLTINGTTNTSNLIVASLTSGTCDVKAYSNGTIYCGTDDTGTSADGTGGWTNNTQNTSTTLNVGIGTSNPQEELHIYKNQTGAITGLLIENPNDINPRAEVTLKTGQSGGHYWTLSNAGNGNGEFAISRDAQPASLIITLTGKVGINMSSGTYPNQTLDLNGNIGMNSNRVCWNSNCSAYTYFNGTCLIHMVGATQDQIC